MEWTHVKHRDSWPSGEHYLKAGKRTVLCVFLVPAVHSKTSFTGQARWRCSVDGYQEGLHYWLRAKTLEGAKREAVRLLEKLCRAEAVRLTLLTRGIRDRADFGVLSSNIRYVQVAK